LNETKDDKKKYEEDEELIFTDRIKSTAELKEEQDLWQIIRRQAFSLEIEF
jgi:hypothetical protein